MRQIDDEMRDMLMMANDTRSAIREMNEAFEGDQEVEYIAETVNDRLKVHKQKRKRTHDRLATAKARALEPIMEEKDNEYALVLHDSQKNYKIRQMAWIRSQDHQHN